jgi:hypothetical protein
MTYARMLREEKGRETFGLYDYAAEGYKKDALFFSRQINGSREIRVLFVLVFEVDALFFRYFNIYRN